MYESDDEQSERVFYYHESKNNKNNNIENDDSVTLSVSYVKYLFKKAIYIIIFYLFSVSLWRRANARNVRLYYPYRQYTNLFIFRFVSEHCLRSTLHIINLLLTSPIAWSFIRENMRLWSFMYGQDLGLIFSHNDRALG